MLHAVIMAGGSGTRFWPLSRKKLPKQFLKLFGERSLLQQASDRIVGLVGPERVMVVTNQQQVAATREQLPDVPAEQIIGEPTGRDTAACLALAAALLVRGDADARMIVLAADHLIEPTQKFHAAVAAADSYVTSHPEALMTFGVPPTRPATGYGYLRQKELARDGEAAVWRLASFHEKPKLADAEAFVASGDYCWNAGIFCWRAATLLAEIGRLQPALRAAVDVIADAWPTPQRDAVFAREYEQLPKISIDYAVMERAPNVCMVRAPFQWDDVGSWLALERVLPADPTGNIGLGRWLAHDSRNCVIAAGGAGRLVATLGVADLIVVQTDDVTLVAHRKDEQRVKELLARLASEGLSLFE